MVPSIGFQSRWLQILGISPEKAILVDTHIGYVTIRMGYINVKIPLMLQLVDMGLFFVFPLLGSFSYYKIS